MTWFIKTWNDFYTNIFKWLYASPQLYDEADMQEEKVRISRAMGSVQDKELIQEVLDFSLSVSTLSSSFLPFASITVLLVKT